MLAAKVEKGNIQVDVQDTGFGIPAADLPFIFDRFYRVRNGKNSEVEGNGLGLAIVKSVVEQHGGQISVESEVDKGTLFQLFPAADAAGETHSTSFEGQTLAKG